MDADKVVLELARDSFQLWRREGALSKTPELLIKELEKQFVIGSMFSVVDVLSMTPSVKYLTMSVIDHMPQFFPGIFLSRTSPRKQITYAKS